MMTQQPSRNVGIREVARLAGVSRQTVSRVINGHPSLRPETRDRVLMTIEQLGYRPNRLAQALGRGSSGTLGVLLSQRVSYSAAGEALLGIEAAAREAGYLVNTTRLVDSDPESLREALELQTQAMVEGLVVIAPQTSILKAIDELRLDTPYVLLHARAGTDPHEIFVDQHRGARAAVRHLIDLGHRDILHITGPQEWIEAEARMQGYLDELGAADLEPLQPVLGDWTADFGYRAGLELGAMADFTAVFAGNDLMALGLIHGLHDCGLNVPGDVSVVGFDDVPEAAHYLPPLTTVRQDFAALGRHCVVRLLGAEDPVVGSMALPPALVVRASTGRPRR